MLSGSIDVIYQNVPLEKLESYETLKDQDVIIFENSTPLTKEIQDYIESNNVTLVYLNMSSNEITVVYRQILEIKNLNDFLQLIQIYTQNQTRFSKCGELE